MLLRKLPYQLTRSQTHRHLIRTRWYSSQKPATVNATAAVILGNQKFPARSWFFPKNTRAAIEKTVRKFQPDAIILDLEDSVSLEEKPLIRKEYEQVLKDGVLMGRHVFIRTSSLKEMDEVEKDVQIFTSVGITGFLLPKVEAAEEVLEVEKLVDRFETKVGRMEGATRLIPIAETPGAYFDLKRIASCSKRNVGIFAGSGDFTAGALCDDHSPPYDAFFSNVALAARSADIAAFCGVHDKLDDHAGFERYCLKMKQCGYNGTAVLTPKQLQMANGIFQYTHRERQWIGRVLDNTKNGEAVKSIQPSIQESRQMIGPPHREKAMKMRELDRIIQSSEEPSKSTESASRDCRRIRAVQPRNGMSAQLTVGKFMPTPHQVTVTESWKTLWDSVFLSTAGIHTSQPRFFAATGYNGLPLPFSLAATITLAFAVSSLSYHARVHLCFKNMLQHRPLLTGDTVRAVFRINSIEPKRGGDGNEYSVANTTHQLLNQENKLVIEMDKLTMFSPTHCTIASNPENRSHEEGSSKREKPVYEDLILQQPVEKLLPNCSQPALKQGQLLTHDFSKVFGHSETRMLCTLLRIVNPHHHNIVRYQSTDILIPGPFVMAAAIGNAALDLGEVLYEDIPHCVNPNKVNFGDQIGTLTYVIGVKNLEKFPHLEEVKVKHIALKNTDMEVLASTDLPREVVEGELRKPSEYEKICAIECPMLLHKISCIVERRIVRVRPGIITEKK